MLQSAPFPVFPELLTHRLRLRAICASDAHALMAIHGNAHAMRYFGGADVATLAQARKIAAKFGKWHLQGTTSIRWGLELRAISDGAAASVGAPRSAPGRPKLNSAPLGGSDDGAAASVGALCIGTCGFHGWNKGWRRALLGYELSVAHTGNGYMQEALRAIMQWAFVNMPLNRIEALIRPENSGSIATVRALRFTKEATLRKVALMHGEFHDMLQFVMLAEDFLAPRR